MSGTAPHAHPWPELPYGEWRETLATFHMWMQIVGKIRVALVPWVNHQWHVTLGVAPRGLTSRPIPWKDETFQLDVDVFDDELRISSSNGETGRVALEPRTVADFYRALMGELERMGLPVRIHERPNEVPDPVPFPHNERDRSYDGEYVRRFWRALHSATAVLEDFRGEFIGKSSPVHFFWGAMDLAVTRFSGRPAPEHPGGIPELPDRVTREAYSHEVSSAGFWPGGEGHPSPLFYAYAYPTPEGLPEAEPRPAAAHWDPDLSEFVLPYEAVRTSPTPRDDLMAFLRSTYEAAADRGGWDRSGLEWGPGERPPVGGFGA